MLKGKEFGKAIDKAIQLMLESGRAKSKAEIARHFDMKPPSLADWLCEEKGKADPRLN